MVTFFVIYDPFSRTFVRQGRAGFYTYSMNAAKHFTSEWSARKYIEREDVPSCYTVKKICHD